MDSAFDNSLNHRTEHFYTADELFAYIQDALKNKKFSKDSGALPIIIPIITEGTTISYCSNEEKNKLIEIFKPLGYRLHIIIPGNKEIYDYEDGCICDVPYVMIYES